MEQVLIFMSSIKIWVGAACTLVILSFLYKENPVYRFFEHVFVGLGIGYGAGLAWTNVMWPNWGEKIIKGDLIWLVLLIPGSLWYFQFSKKNVWLSRIPIGFFMGYGSGMIFKSYYESYFSPERGQVTQSFKSLWVSTAGNVDWAATVNNWLFIIILLCCLSYFFFSFKHEKNAVLRGSTKLGRMFLMICFGAIFGNTIMARISLLIQRLEFLLSDWLKIIPKI